MGEAWLAARLLGPLAGGRLRGRVPASPSVSRRGHNSRTGVRASPGGKPGCRVCWRGEGRAGGRLCAELTDLQSRARGRCQPPSQKRSASRDAPTEPQVLWVSREGRAREVCPGAFRRPAMAVPKPAMAGESEEREELKESGAPPREST